MNNNNFKSFKFKDALLGSTEVDRSNGILRILAAVALKYLSSFWILINCKVEFELKWMNHYFGCGWC